MLTWIIGASLLVGNPSIAAAGSDGLTPGSSYFGRNHYIEYVAGDLPLILSVPHGGNLVPDEIPDRAQAVTVADPWSIDYAMALADVFYQLTGRHPHIVINHLQRVKLDANRNLEYGAQNSPAAQQAWNEFNDFIDLAEASAVEQCGGGLYLDLHSNGQAGGWIQLGYGISASDLTLSDEWIDRPAHVAESSLRSMASVSGEGLSSLVRGPASLGGLLEARGYRAVPSDVVPWPYGITYYDGGYNLFRHGSGNGGVVDGIQLETSVEYIRPETIQTYTRVLGEAILSFMEIHYGFNLAKGSKMLCPTFADVRPGQPAFTAIETLYKEGVLQPCSEDPRLFCPEAPLTRGDAARMIGKVIRLDPLAAVASEPLYRDVPPDDPLNTWAAVMWRAGLIGSCRKDRMAFCPDDAVSRADAARIFLQIIKGPTYLPSAPSGVFTDLIRSDWKTWWIEAAYVEGLVQPCAGGASLQFCPADAFRRDEAAALLAMIVDMQPHRLATGEAYAP